MSNKNTIFSFTKIINTIYGYGNDNTDGIGAFKIMKFDETFENLIEYDSYPREDDKRNEIIEKWNKLLNSVYCNKNNIQNIKKGNLPKTLKPVQNRLLVIHVGNALLNEYENFLNTIKNKKDSEWSNFINGKERRRLDTEKKGIWEAIINSIDNRDGKNESIIDTIIRVNTDIISEYCLDINCLCKCLEKLINELKEDKTIIFEDKKVFDCIIDELESEIDSYKSLHQGTNTIESKSKECESLGSVLSQLIIISLLGQHCGILKNHSDLIIDITEIYSKSERNIINTLRDNLDRKLKKRSCIDDVSIDSTLFPTGYYYKSNKKYEGSLYEFIRNSWKNRDGIIKHLVVVGEGGIGKSVSILYFLSSNDSRPAVYIPLGELERNYISSNDNNSGNPNILDRYIENNYAKENAVIKEMSDRTITTGPNIVFYLDGYNEVRPEFQEIIDNCINEIVNNRFGVQLIISSRSKPKCYSSDMDIFYIKSLEKCISKEFLLKNSVDNITDETIEVCNTPLFLSLYAYTEQMRIKLNLEDVFNWKAPISKGVDIYWNYLQLEIHNGLNRIDTGIEMRKSDMFYVALILCPYIAYRSITRTSGSLMTIEKEELKKYINECLAQNDRLKEVYSRTFTDVNEDMENGIKDDRDIKTRENVYYQIITKYNFIIKEDLVYSKCYSFLHQNMQDYLLALHIKNILMYYLYLNNRSIDCNLYKEKLITIFENSLFNYLADVFDDKELDYIWKMNKDDLRTLSAEVEFWDEVENEEFGWGFTNDGALFDINAGYVRIAEFLLKIYGFMYKGDYSHVDFRTMDLSNINLTECRPNGGYKLTIPYNGNSYLNSSVSLNTFSKNGNYGEIINITLIEDLNIAITADVSGEVYIRSIVDGSIIFDINRCFENEADKQIRDIKWIEENGRYTIVILTGELYVFILSKDMIDFATKYKAWGIPEKLNAKWDTGVSRIYEKVTCVQLKKFEGRLYLIAGTNTGIVYRWTEFQKNPEKGRCFYIDVMTGQEKDKMGRYYYSQQGAINNIEIFAYNNSLYGISCHRNNKLFLWNLMDGKCRELKKFFIFNGKSEYIKAKKNYLSQEKEFNVYCQEKGYKIWEKLDNKDEVKSKEDFINFESRYVYYEDIRISLMEKKLNNIDVYIKTKDAILKLEESLHVLEKELKEFQSVQIMDAKFFYDKQNKPKIIICDSKGEVFIIDPFNEGDRAHSLDENHYDCINGIEIYEDGDPYAYTYGCDGIIKKWNLSTRKLICESNHDHKGEILKLDMINDCIISLGNDGFISISDMNFQNLYKLNGKEFSFMNCYKHNDQIRIMTGNKSGAIELWDILSNHCLYTKEGRSFEILDVEVFEKNNEIIYLIASTDGLLRLFDYNTNRCLKVLPGSKSKFRYVEVDINANYIMIFGADNMFYFYNITDLDNIIYSMTQSDDKHHIIESIEHDCKYEKENIKHIDTLIKLVYNNDIIKIKRVGNESFLIGRVDGIVELWHTEKEESMLYLYKHNERISDLNYLRNENGELFWIISGSVDGAMILYNVVDGCKLEVDIFKTLAKDDKLIFDIDPFWVLEEDKFYITEIIATDKDDEIILTLKNGGYCLCRLIYEKNDELNIEFYEKWSLFQYRNLENIKKVGGDSYIATRFDNVYFIKELMGKNNKKDRGKIERCKLLPGIDIVDLDLSKCEIIESEDKNDISLKNTLYYNGVKL